ncbi:hypothetical protein Acr_00g0027830 [Actinidia rufa]|uniref:Reverse transcriptase domain-containing protein n=1 Tax=Actinidia rufa TaxID=165716 RepID=A0A7J0DFZ1_9ERIC|nr:hypothetical protein Acr_00g0027830 [Actinidia rufa]
MWTQHDSFLDLVSNVWSMRVDGTAMFRLCKKLKALKEPLKALNKHDFSHISARAEAAEMNLNQAQQSFHDNPGDINLQIRVSEIRVKAIKLVEAEMSFCAHLAKAKYLKNSDRGTKFFHNLIKSNKAINQIISITKADGEVTSSFQEGPLVQEEHGHSLIQPVIDKEIKDTLFDIGDNKAPGPDGFSSVFFKKAWNIVGLDVCEAVEEFFRFGRLLKQINHAAIVLVLTTANAARVEDFRPIACCNVVYKLISKILAKRLAPILEDLVDPAQSAFIPNRNMVENIYLVQELLRKYGWRRISPRCIMKIDIRKAYDTQGLRQGDPKSPFLFTLCLEYLSRNLKRLKLNSDFNFHPNCLDLNITHLAFADDLILFARGDVPSVKLSMDCLSQFGDISGLLINTNKSNVFMVGINSTDMAEIKTITGFRMGKFPFRYLGIPVAATRLTIEQFRPLTAKISEYISAWAGATLSYAGRSELIRSVIQGLKCFWLSILPISVGVRDKIVALCRNFLWLGKAASPKKPLVAWKDVCKPKSEGDLGFIDLNAWNMALMSKIPLELASKERLLMGEMGEPYLFKRAAFMGVQSDKARLPNDQTALSD